MRESGAEGSEVRGKLRDERHSHVIREREGEREEGREGGRERRRQKVTGPNGSIDMLIALMLPFPSRVRPHTRLRKSLCIVCTLEGTSLNSA